MTHFSDGPAKGHTLMLRRAARFLRVTEVAGTFDALDQLEDEAKPNEKIYAYEITGTPGWAFVDGKRISGRYAIADYHLFPVQPSDGEMRSNTAWAEWCTKNNT